MFIKKIELQNFRNHPKKDFEFSTDSTLISGNNGAGKTNVIEAVYMLSLGKSFRAPTEKDVVNIDSPFAKITGYFDDLTKLELHLERSNTGRVKKTFKKNGAIKKTKEFIGVFKSVLFNPEDIRLVIGSPSRRRDYLDSFLSQVFYEYYRSLNKYGRILKHRNKLLDMSQGQVVRNFLESQLEVWDKQLIEAGIVVQEYRRRFFNYAEEVLPAISSDLFGSDFVLKIDYKSSFINENTLESHKRTDLIKGYTTVGPHRDDFDFIFYRDGKAFDLRSFGSRGQQRMAVLALKLLEIKYIEEKSKQRPVLLLDDIFSELDDHFRGNIEKIMKNYQCIVTSAEDIHQDFDKVIQI